MNFFKEKSENSTESSVLHEVKPFERYLCDKINKVNKRQNEVILEITQFNWFFW